MAHKHHGAVHEVHAKELPAMNEMNMTCLLYTSDAADE